MEVEIVSPDIPINDSVEHLIADNFNSLVAWNWRELRLVRVALSEFEGLEGWVKVCRVTVVLRTGYQLSVACTGVSLPAVVSAASRSADRAVEDALRAERPRRRRSLGVLF